MLFNSFDFLLFFPIVTILFFALPHKLRWFHLLVASCLFYMAFVPIYIVILLGTIIVDYIAGILIEGSQGSVRKMWLTMSIIANVGVLAAFKYYNFIAVNVNDLLHITNVAVEMPLLHMILPIGLSFHTFQAMSYTIEVYRGNHKAERHLGIYSLYVMFYPQLVAGPIERPQNVLYQFHEEKKLQYDNVAIGGRLMLWGLFKKVLIADRLALVVNSVYENPSRQSGITLAITCVFFAYQIFCDFSGYSDIARGAAKVMGYDLMVNFRTPFNAKSITEFWRRWHISLATWFTDYLFNPIVVRLRNWGVGAVIIGILVTFFLSGLWHGAGWTYIIYGLLNGTVLIYEYYTRKQRKKIFKKMPEKTAIIVSKTFTMLFILLSFVIFRAASMKDAFDIYRNMTHIPTELARVFSTHKIAFLHMPGLFNTLIPGFSLIALLELAHVLQARWNIDSATFSARPLLLRWGLYFSTLFALFYFGVHEKHMFIYFQF